jgi:5-deoxy-glucuronate isomerase
LSSLLVTPHVPDDSGCVVRVTPEKARWKYVGFQVHRLAAGQTLRGGERDREACILLLTGCADVIVDNSRFGNVGARSSVFEDASPGAVYCPGGRTFLVTATHDAEVAICSGPGTTQKAPRQISAADMTSEVRGTGTNTRYVRNILPETKPADSLMIVEVITPGGHWSSYPPHKHDTAVAGRETALEETYYYRFKPPQGFGFQRVYTDNVDLDETLCFHDGDVVMVPRGYHPVCSAHGYDLYYLNVMAGPHRAWVIRNDPQHEWILRATPAKGS